MQFFRHFQLKTKHSGQNFEHYGSSEDHIRFIHGEAQQPVPYVMFCPACGEVWARMPVVNSMADWRIIGGYCELHGKSARYVVPGSLILNWEPELTKILPDAVIRREFDLHVRLWEREHVGELEGT